MRFQLSLLITAAACLLQLDGTVAGGYHYDPPARAQPPTYSYSSGHNFAPLATVRPLPPVPALPPLPTARPHVHVQTLQQVHPHTPQQSIAAAYRPPSATAQPRPNYVLPSGVSAPSGIAHIAQAYQTQQQAPPAGFGQRISAPPVRTVASFGPSAPAAGPQPTAPPLRIPFGKQAIIHYGPPAPANDIYVANGRQLKQYAVVEIIDNDIAHTMQPFLANSFFDSFRAQIGASGTGATGAAAFSTSGGAQLNSRSNALVLEQQRMVQQQQLPRGAAAGDPIALGSGGLGYVRLANGNVFLGSGSLGYVSGQQRTQSINEARTRAGASVPDPVHFGHGALGSPSPSNFFRYK